MRLPEGCRGNAVGVKKSTGITFDERRMDWTTIATKQSVLLATNIVWSSECLPEFTQAFSLPRQPRLAIH
jgi:hypothetical protein